MADSSQPPSTLSADAARLLANTTKTPPQWVGVTPRWLVSLLPWTPVESGTYRVNKVKEATESEISIQCSPTDGDEIPKAAVDYEENPREYTLSTGDDDHRRADAYQRSVSQPDGSGSRAARRPDRDGQGAPGE